MNLFYANNSTFLTSHILRPLVRALGISKIYLIDFMAPPEIPDVEIVYLESHSVMFGHYEGVNWSSLQPLDDPVLREMAHCEVECIKMFDRQGKYGRLQLYIDDCDRRGLPPYRRTETACPYDNRKFQYLRHLRYWHHVISTEGIDFAVGMVPPHHMHDFIVFHLCKNRGIPVHFFDQLPHNRLLARHGFESNARLNQIREEALAVAESGASIDLDPGTDAFIRLQVDRSRDPHPWYMAFFEPSAWEYNRISMKDYTRYPLGTVRWWVRYALYWWRRDEIVRQMRRRRDLRRIRIKKDRELKVIRTYYSELSEPADPESKYIYCPFHYTPEPSPSPMGGLFSEQFVTVEILSSLVPDDVYIYVKDHPHQKSLTRSVEMLRHLADLRNVRLVPIETNTFRLIERCIAVATLVGTAGYEALFWGKPALYFGECTFAYAPGAFRVRSTDDVRLALDEILSGRAAPTEGALRAFFHMLDRISSRGTLMGQTAQHTSDQVGLSLDEMGEEMAASIVENYSSQLMASRDEIVDSAFRSLGP